MSYQAHLCRVSKIQLGLEIKKKLQIKFLLFKWRYEKSKNYSTFDLAKLRKKIILPYPASALNYNNSIQRNISLFF